MQPKPLRSTNYNLLQLVALSVYQAGQDYNIIKFCCITMLDERLNVIIPTLLAFVYFVPVPGFQNGGQISKKIGAWVLKYDWSLTYNVVKRLLKRTAKRSNIVKLKWYYD